MEVLKPRSITRLGDGRWEVDFGDYVTGWVRIHGLNAPEGTEVEMEFPIEVDGNGTYKYICSGSGDADPEALVRRVREAVDLFTEGAAQFDDITMLCYKYNGRQ